MVINIPQFSFSLAYTGPKILYIFLSETFSIINLGRLKFIQERWVIGILFENLRNCATAVVVENKMLSTIKCCPQ